jgi:hypothetical protein
MVSGKKSLVPIAGYWRNAFAGEIPSVITSHRQASYRSSKPRAKLRYVAEFPAPDLLQSGNPTGVYGRIPVAHLTLPPATTTILGRLASSSGKVRLTGSIAMRVFRICGCVLLLVPLSGILGCGGAYVKKGPETKTNTVKISNCTADPDTAKIPKNYTLTWIADPPDGHNYSIKFPKRTPVSSSMVSTGQAQKVTGDFWCNTLGGISTSLCVYPYNLVQDDTKTCPDPGVHVGP